MKVFFFAYFQNLKKMDYPNPYSEFICFLSLVMQWKKQVWKLNGILDWLILGV